MIYYQQLYQKTTLPALSVRYKYENTLIYTLRTIGYYGSRI